MGLNELNLDLQAASLESVDSHQRGGDQMYWSSAPAGYGEVQL